MNTLDVHRYNMLVRVREFGAQHPDLFPPDTLGGKTFAAVAAALGTLDDFATSQAAGFGAFRARTTAKAIARETLRDALDAIGRAAQVLAVGTPGLDGKFRLPRSRSDHQLAIAARAFAQLAAPLAAQFIAHNLPATFLADLQATLEAFETAAQDHAAARETHVSASASLSGAMEAALTAVEALDVIVPNRLRDEPGLLAGWESARHVERLRGTTGDNGPQAATPASPQPPNVVNRVTPPAPIPVAPANI